MEQHTHISIDGHTLSYNESLMEQHTHISIDGHTLSYYGM